MSFWSSETLKQRVLNGNLITPFYEDQVEHGAYELTVGPEAFLTSTDDEKKQYLDVGHPVVIPPGQFALLLTEEFVTMPDNAIGFISMRFSVKRRGLINVSGFHVDPGYNNRLKFSVYNAGSLPITLQRGQRVFMIWFSDLDGHTKDVYAKHSPDNDIITADDQNAMHGKVASPAQLRKDLDEVKGLYFNHKGYLAVIIGVLIAILGRLVFLPWALPQDERRSLKEEILKDLHAAQQSGASSPQSNADPASTAK